MSEPDPSSELEYANVPPELRPPFQVAEGIVADYFAQRHIDPHYGHIAFGGERYILLRASSIAFQFVETVKSAHDELFDDEDAVRAARSVLYDVAHTAGDADARSFHARAPIDDPVHRLASGPIHFAFTGWGTVKVLPESVAANDENYCLIYEHASSFESNAWLEAGRSSDAPVCVMNAGYSSGWCSSSFQLDLHAVEILCRARGDDCCRFIMAPEHRLRGRVEDYRQQHAGLSLAATPTYLEGAGFLAQLGRAHRELEASERIYRALFTDTQDAVLVSSPAGELLKANAAGLDFLGLAEDSIPGARLDELVRDPKHDLLVERVLAEGAYRGDVRFRTSQGDEHVGLASVVASPQHLAETDDLRWIVHDITQRLRYEERLRERQHLESLGSLSAGVAHDFNNLLAATLNSAALLGRSLAEDDPLQEAVRTIQSAAERGRDLTDRLLSYGRGGRYELRKVSPNALVESVLALLQPTLDPRIKLETKLDPDVPWVLVDRAQLESALLNVCVNARDALPSGGTITVATRATTPSGMLATVTPKPIPDADVDAFAVISVSDDGTGMTPEVLRRAREPFFTTKPRGHGTGLGLAMVEGVVRNHHGQLELISTPGRGTQVLLQLPGIARSDSHVEELSPLDEQEPVRPVHVLVVDDTEPVATSTAKLLELSGHRVTVCLDGEGALSRIQAGLDCQVVLLDLLLPGIDGHETYRRMRALRPTLPVIVFSGYAHQDDVASLVADGVRFLAKPFQIDHLLGEIDLALRS